MRDRPWSEKDAEFPEMISPLRPRAAAYSSARRPTGISSTAGVRNEKTLNHNIQTLKQPISHSVNSKFETASHSEKMVDQLGTNFAWFHVFIGCMYYFIDTCEPMA